MNKTTRVIRVAGAGAIALLLAAFAGSAAAKDRNHDKLPDRWEKRHKLSLKVNQARKDQDLDGLRNRGEFRSGTDPRDADSDDDGVEDADEDRDRDNVDNGNEQSEGTKQNDVDSDDDKVKDGREDADDDDLDNKGEDQTGNDPVDPDTDDDEIEDGDEQAGTVASFDGTTLVINLATGGQLSGKVNESTEIKCETEDEHEDEDESGDDDGPGDDGPGEDDDEHGDDDEGGESDSASVSSEGEGHDGSSNEMDDEEHGDDDDLCTVADLIPGTPVHEAELEGGVFEEVELIK